MMAAKPTAELAYEILKKAKSPMHYTEITKRIQRKKKLRGKRPWCTVNAALCKDSRFVRVGEGRTGLYELRNG